MTKEPTAYRRYRDLLEYFGDDSILEDDEEFKKWLKRIKWHVRKANELYRKYECQKEPCEDAVSRKDMYFKLTNGAYRNETIEQFIDRLVKELEDMPPVEPARNWIPCSERLPEENGFYLATCDGEICGENEPFTGLAEYENGKWVDDEEDYQCVLAWMPLPKPYKESEKA